MAKVTVISYHNGSMPREMEGSTPAELATELDISLQGVSINVSPQHDLGLSGFSGRSRDRLTDQGA